MLAIELAEFRNVRTERFAHQNGFANRFQIGNWQSTRQTEANRAGMLVRLGTEGIVQAATEHFGVRRELDVDL